MTEPYVKTFTVNLPDGQLTMATIVMDQEDFDALVDELLATQLHVKNLGANMDDAIVQRLKEVGHIPMISRGLLTEFLFTRYDIQCDKAAVIVRGKGLQMLNQAMGPDQELNWGVGSCHMVIWEE